METVSVDNQLTIIDKSLEIFKGGSQILRVHQDRAMKALAVGGKLLQQWATADAIDDEDARMAAYAEADQKSNDFLVKCGSAKTQMEESRKAITQMMDMIKKMFTEEEGKLDAKKGGVPADIQSRRNKYATDMAGLTERRRIAAEAKAAKEKERVEVVAAMNNAIAQGLLNLLSTKKVQINTSFNAITLEKFEDKSSKLYRMPCAFPAGAQFFEIAVPRVFRHTSDEAIVLKNQTINGYNYDQFAIEYERQVRELKESLIARLPAKKQELEEIAEAARIQEQNRLAKEAADKKAAEAKSAKAKAEAAAEQKRLADEKERADAEAKRLADERELREKAEEERLQKEKEAAEKEAADKRDLELAAGTAQTLFDQVADTNVDAAAPETRTGFNIVVGHAAGWIEMITFWYQREGVKLSLDDLEKKTFKQIKTFCEGVAKKDDVKIESKYLTYASEIKSVNRKAK